MTGNKFTSGPWVIKFENDGDVGGIYAANGERIVETDSGYYPPRINDANLIAAAPELYEALKACLKEDSGLICSKQVAAAIAKAEGRT